MSKLILTSSYTKKFKAKSGRVYKRTIGCYICYCGKYFQTRVDAVVGNRTKSCGCLNEKARKVPKISHGKSYTPEYNAWACMIQRSTNRNLKSAPKYILRGITVCKRWLKFENFFKDMGIRPSKKHSIDRIDNNKGYSKSNCRWATIFQQNYNKRNTVKVKFQGRIMTINEIAAKMGVTRSRAYYLYSRGNL